MDGLDIQKKSILVRPTYSEALLKIHDKSLLSGICIWKDFDCRILRNGKNLKIDLAPENSTVNLEWNHVSQNV